MTDLNEYYSVNFDAKTKLKNNILLFSGNNYIRDTGGSLDVSGTYWQNNGGEDIFMDENAAEIQYIEKGLYTNATITVSGEVYGQDFKLKNGRSLSNLVNDVDSHYEIMVGNNNSAATTSNNLQSQIDDVSAAAVKITGNHTMAGSLTLKNNLVLSDTSSNNTLTMSYVESGGNKGWHFNTNKIDGSGTIYITNPIEFLSGSTSTSTSTYTGDNTFMSSISIKDGEEDLVAFPGGAGAINDRITFNIPLDVHSVVVKNNLYVNGDLDISDNMIRINRKASGEEPPTGSAGIEIEMGSGDVSNVRIQWNFDTTEFELIDEGGDMKSLKCKTVETTSDIRFKEDIVPILDSKKLIQQFKPVYWKWKNNHKKSCGLVAQDVMKISPEAVGGSKDSLALNYNYFIGLLISRVQEMEKEIQSLKK